MTEELQTKEAAAIAQLENIISMIKTGDFKVHNDRFKSEFIVSHKPERHPKRYTYKIILQETKK